MGSHSHGGVPTFSDHQCTSVKIPQNGVLSNFARDRLRASKRQVFLRWDLSFAFAIQHTPEKALLPGLLRRATAYALGAFARLSLLRTPQPPSARPTIASSPFAATLASTPQQGRMPIRARPTQGVRISKHQNPASYLESSRSTPTLPQYGVFGKFA